MAIATVTDVYRMCGLPSDGSVITDNDIMMHLEAAESLVEERYIGTCLQPNGRQVTETYDGDGTDTLFLNNYPLRSVDSLTINSTSITTSLLWFWESTGKIKLKTTAEVTTFLDTYPQLVSITYTYGRDAKQYEIDFIAGIAAMRVLTQQIGGTFDDVTSFQLPEMSGSLGEPYTNIREALARLDGILKGMVASGQIRQYAQFG